MNDLLFETIRNLYCYPQGSKPDAQRNNERVFDAWLNKIKSEAWDEGCREGSYWDSDIYLNTPNPYRTDHQ